MPVVTISASYGAGGSQVGPRLADRLGVAFLDRAIPTAVAERLAVPLSEAIAHDEAVRSVLERLLVRFAPAAQAFSGDHAATRDPRRALLSEGHRRGHPRARGHR